MISAISAVKSNSEALDETFAELAKIDTAPNFQIDFDPFDLHYSILA